MIAALPPVPDNQTGEPRPPYGPPVAEPWSGVNADHVPPGGAYGLRDRPRALIGGHISYPLLERAAVRRTHAVGYAFAVAVAAAVIVPVTAGLAVYVTAIATAPIAVGITVVVFAVILGLLAVSGLLSEAHDVVEAGPRGVAKVRDDGREPVIVDLYLLTAVTVRDGSSGLQLTLTDRNEKSVSLPCGLVEGNPDLWALVYNGIRHSAAGGASIDAHTRALLALPHDEPDDSPTERSSAT